MKSAHKLQFGTPSFRRISIGLVVFFVITSTILVTAALHYNRRSLLAGVRNSLQVILTTTAEGLRIWMKDQKYFISQLGKNKFLVENVQQLLEQQKSSRPLQTKQKLITIRQFLNEYQDNDEQLGFFILNPDLINIAADQNHDIGLPSFLNKTHPDLLARVFQGETVFIPPIHLRGTPFSDPSIFFAAPVIDQTETIIAVIALRLDPTKNFSRVIQLGRLGQSGETYAFNEQGQLLSESRFTRQLQEIGLLGADEKAILNIRITDPGRNILTQQPPQPLT
ncbi:MAG: hypothetical protein D3910_11805, partial [Candidatus Electrothrix sp. ATG2]|nr:hypothetical protein [Candidatus Electrothrix sp. ATG2]